MGAYRFIAGLSVAALLSCLLAAHAETSKPALNGQERCTTGNEAGCQGWSDEVRRWMYHEPQGTVVIPYDWFLNLRLPDPQKKGAGKLIADPDNLRKYGFILDAKSETNPDGLPVGFARQEKFPFGFTCDGEKDSLPQLGFNCTGCHTGEIHYPGKPPLRIDGGPSMHDNQRFIGELHGALKALTNGNEHTKPFVTFAKDVLRKEPTPEQRQKLFGCVKKFMKESWPRLLKEAEDMGLVLYPRHLPWGPGRMDALVRVGNVVFEKLNPGNLRAYDAPVNYPAVWYASKQNWVQWTAPIENPMTRNIAQAIGLNAPLDFDDENPVHEKKRIRAAVDVRKLYEFEQHINALKPPAWPGVEFFGQKGKIGDISKGKELYDQHCARCHDYKVVDAPPPCEGQVWQVHVPPNDVVGTDPLVLWNLTRRMVKTGPLGPPERGQHDPQDKGFFDKRLVPAVDVMEKLTQSIMDQQFENVPDKTERQKMTNCRENHWNGPAKAGYLGYKAAPLAGIWATAPYLHNGSVPNLYLLLSTKAERNKKADKFCAGSLIYDPSHVGFEFKKASKPADCGQGLFFFDTSLPGNSNAGHEFDCGRRKPDGSCEADNNGAKMPWRPGVVGPKLDEADKMAIIQYLKAL